LAEPISSFVARRRTEWERLQALLGALDRRAVRLGDLESLDRLYRRTAADLARAQVQYPGTDAHRFLNQLCARAYARIYRTPRDRGAAVARFFRRELPALVRGELRYVAASAALFVAGIALGALVVAVEPRGAELLVPATVRDAVAERRMWTDDLLSVSPPSVAASAIATNNLTVTVAAFAGGLLAGLGTAFILVNNGVLLGAVFAHCAQAGMGWRLVAFVGAHGPVELSIIVLAGAAGLMVADALIDPGERPRGAHVQARGRRAVAMVLGCAPFLALIGVVEGYVSPGDLFPAAVKLLLGMGLGAAFWLYLVLTGLRWSHSSSGGQGSCST
jgi:uncharacterized membrane protein SpoIIM required for sporulation